MNTTPRGAHRLRGGDEPPSEGRSGTGGEDSGTSGGDQEASARGGSFVSKNPSGRGREFLRGPPKKFGGPDQGAPQQRRQRATFEACGRGGVRGRVSRPGGPRRWPWGGGA